MNRILNNTFNSVLVIGITLLIMFIALFYLQGFGLLLIITLLVMHHVARYVNKVTVWFALRAWRKVL